MAKWILGDVSANETLTVDDHLYETLLNQYRAAHPVTVTVDTSGNGQFSNIQSAINEIQSTGGLVFLREGTWTLSAALTIPSNVWLIGTGYNTLIKATTNLNTYLLANSDQTNGNTNIRIMGIRFDQDQANQSTSGTYVGMLHLKRVSYTQVENCWLLNATDIGVSFEQNCQWVKANHNYIDSYANKQGGSGIKFLRTTTNAEAVGNYIVNGNASNESIGVQCLWDTYQINMSKNYVIGGQVGLEATGKYTADDNTNCSLINIHNNISKNQTLVGIKMEQDTQAFDISGNIVSGDLSTYPDTHGIYAFSGRYGKIRGNTVLNMGAYGIYASQAAAQNACEELQITENRVVGSGLSGIQVENSNDGIIANNVCKDNSADAAGSHNGISVIDSLNLSIIGNRCFDSAAAPNKKQDYGIESTGTSDYLCVVGNTLNGNKTAATSLSGSNNVNANNIT